MVKIQTLIATLSGKKKSAGIRRTYFRLWRNFRSRDFMWRHFRSGPLPVTSLPATHAQWPAPLCSPRNMPWAVPKYYFDIWILGVTINNPWKNIEGRQSSCPLGVSINGIFRAFNWLKWLGEFLHLKPTVGCQISTLIFEIFFMEGGLYEYPMNNILRTAKFLPTWCFNQRYFPGL